VRPQKRSAVTASVPAPVGGWNARDAISNMDPMDAVRLENWFARPTDVMLRKGNTAHVTGLPGQVESLMPYNTATSQTLFAASVTSFYNVTTPGAVGAAVQTGLTNAKWQSVNITTSGGSFLYAVNGVDKPRLWNGATWVAVDGASSPQILGVTTTTLIHVNLFKNRLWFTQAASLKVWYLPVDSVGGTANAIDLSSVARNGGYLVGMWNWTIDAGYGVDDLAAFITSEGEVIVYRGTDPSSVLTWALVGIWTIGSPLGRRCAIKYAGDLLIACHDGIVPMSAALQSSRVNPKVALSDKIQQAFSGAASLYGSSFGWDMRFFPKENMLVLNIPIAVGSQQQYVMNSISKAWSQFTGWPANCWELFDDNLYYGGNEVVCQAYNGYNDRGAQINGSAQQAYNYFGKRGQNKRFTLARPIIQASSSPSVQVGLAIDFNDQAPTSTLTVPPATTSVWDTATWDSGVWGSDLTTYRQWQGIAGVGYAASPYLLAAGNGNEVRWQSTDVVMELGGIV